MPATSTLQMWKYRVPGASVTLETPLTASPPLTALDGRQAGAGSSGGLDEARDVHGLERKDDAVRAGSAGFQHVR